MSATPSPLGPYYTWSDWSSLPWTDLLSQNWPNVVCIYIGGNNVTYNTSSFSINDDINHRSTASITLIDEDKSLNSIVTGMNVEILSSSGIIFAGIITNVKRSFIGKFGSAIQIDIDCSDYTLMTARRLGKYSSDSAVTCGDIVRYIYENYLEDEDILIGEIEDGEELSTAKFPLKTVSEILDTLAEISGYIWYIDYDRKLYFIDRTTYTSDWDIDETSPYILSLEVSEGNSQYRNVQYVTGAKVRTDELTEYFKGDSNQRTFTVGYPIVEEPTIYVNNEIQSVGYKGQENDLIDWYWSPDDPTITQRSNATPLSDTDILRVDYIGSFRLIVKVKRAGEILARRLREGYGTGQYENIEYDVNASDYNQALAITSGLLQEYGSIGYVVNYRTFNPITSGVLQTIYLPSMNINKDFLITSVSISYEDGILMYEVEGVSGPIDPSWEDIFCTIAKNAKSKYLSDMSEAEAVQGVEEFEKTWAYTDYPNIFREVYADGSITPSDTYFPCFESGDRVVYCAIYRNDAEIFRKPITYETIEGNTIISICIIDASEAVGSISHVGIWGGDTATNNLGTGIELAKFTFNYMKTSLETLQFNFYNIRGW